MTIARAFAALPLLTASAAGAHPGHGVEGGSWSLVHFLSDPLHLGFALAVVLGLAGLRGLRRTSQPSRARRG